MGISSLVPWWRQSLLPSPFYKYGITLDIKTRLLHTVLICSLLLPFPISLITLEMSLSSMIFYFEDILQNSNNRSKFNIAITYIRIKEWVLFSKYEQRVKWSLFLKSSINYVRGWVWRMRNLTVRYHETT